MGQPGPVQFEVSASKNLTMTVTTQDGKKYSVELALLVAQVLDSGQINPLDQMPIFQIGTQIVMRVTEKGNGKH